MEIRLQAEKNLVRDPRGCQKAGFHEVTESWGNNKSGDGGQAAEKQRVSILTRHVERDKDPKENEQVADGGEDITEIVLSPPKEIVSFDMGCLVLRLTKYLICRIFVAFA